MPIANITANCVSLVFDDESFLTARWGEISNVLSVGMNKRVVAIRVFHQQLPNLPPFPSNELQFTADGPHHEQKNMIGLKSLGGGSQLLMRGLTLSPGGVRQDIFRSDFSQDINVDLGGTAEEALLAATDVSFQMYSTDESDWQVRVDAALSRTDLGPCSE